MKNKIPKLSSNSLRCHLKKSFILFKITILLFLLNVILFSNLTFCKETVFVSIVPLQYFIDELNDNLYNVEVMVGPGQGPETYNPGPKQMELLSKAKIYFHLGLPFENMLLKKIINLNKNIKLVDLRQVIDQKELLHHSHSSSVSHHPVEDDREDDPHIWSSPKIMLKVIQLMAKNLRELSLLKGDESEKILLKKMDELILTMDKNFKGVKRREFLVFHPAWGYLAKDFKLTQLSFETHGKSPGPKDLSQLHKKIVDKKIKILFYQKQFSSKQANIWREALNLKLVELDPLAYNYFENMNSVTQNLVEALND